MLSASIRRNVWRASLISIFMCDGKWGNLPLFEIARGLLWYWPLIVRQINAGPQGGVVRLRAEPGTSGMQQVLTDPE